MTGGTDMPQESERWWPFEHAICVFLQMEPSLVGDYAHHQLLAGYAEAYEEVQALVRARGLHNEQAAQGA